MFPSPAFSAPDRRVLALLLALLCLPPLARADDREEAAAALQAGLERLADAPALEVSFVETRRVAGLDRALETPGRLWLEGEDKLRWQLGQPPRTLLVVADGRYALHEGQQREAGLLADLGDQRRMVELLGAVFGGDRASLERQFELTDAEARGDNWRLIMTPRLQPVREAIGSLALLVGPDGLPLGWSLRLADGTELAARFESVTTRPSLPAELFAPATD